MTKFNEFAINAPLENWDSLVASVAYMGDIFEEKTPAFENFANALTHVATAFNELVQVLKDVDVDVLVTVAGVDVIVYPVAEGDVTGIVITRSTAPP